LHEIGSTGIVAECARRHRQDDQRGDAPDGPNQPLKGDTTMAKKAAKKAAKKTAKKK
jgi:hypothetical protein